MGSKNKNKKIIDGGDSVGNGKRKEIDDPRFRKVHYDPRFQKVAKHKSKVKIDSRFEGILSNKNFNTAASTRVDKRGKLKTHSENNLQHYYHFEEEEKEEAAADLTKKDKKLLIKKIEDVEEEEVRSDSDSPSSESESEPELNEETGSDDTDIDTDDELDDVEVFGADTSVEVENVPAIDKETHRLAVVNMDWSHVKADDLFVMLSSFLPKEGQIKSVAVYPSEFGLKRMEEEAIRGPVALFEDDRKKDGGDSDDEDADSDEEGDYDDEDSDEVSDNERDADEVSDDEDLDEDDKNEVNDGDEDDVDDLEDNSDNDVGDEDGDDTDEGDDEIDNEKLRAYEKSRLRYYFAVVECDSIATADCLYKACDGLEFERSSNVLDLRFVPDSMEFKHQPRDVATEAPADYEGLDFQTRALQQSNTVLSWDEDEPHRVKTLRRNFNEKQLAEMELNEFLASDESESETDEDDNGDQDPSEKKKKKADMYRALIQSGDGSEQEDEGQNMEVTFATGLEDISKKIIEKKEKGSETVFEAYLRKKKEKKNAEKNKSKTSSDDDSDESDDQEGGEDPDDFFEEAPSVERRKKDSQDKKKSVEKSMLEKEAEASTAELELLLADENGESKKLKGYNLKQKKGKGKGKGKGKKGEETPDETNLPTVDLDDPRFSGLLVNPAFFLDPTDPQFKRSATYRRQLAQRQQKKPEEHEDVEPMEPSKKDGNSVGSTRKAEHELSATIKSVKMKSQQLSVQSTVKIKDKMGSHGPTSGKKHKLPGADRATKKSKLQK